MTSWDPAQYERFADHRTRPFYDLIGRVGAESPSLIIDLGCGNGPMTIAAAERWDQARVVGVDSSAEMLERARALDADARVTWVQADVADWDPSGVGVPDVLLTNATLQWVPGHRDLIPQWLDVLAPGGWFAMQVPGNFEAPSHEILRDVAREHPRADDLLDGYRMTSPVGDPAEYAELLAAHCDHVDAWETTYLQLLDPASEQESPVLEWVKGTALRPFLDKLTDDERGPFLATLTERLNAAYPRAAYGTPFPFRRIFAVGRKAVA